jgi:hypothetical protein
MRRFLITIAVLALPLAALAAPDEDEIAQGLKIRSRTPDLVGPDPIQRAPVLIVTRDRADLDGRSVTPDALQSSMKTLADNYKILQPTGKMNGKFLIACEPEVETSRLAEYLARARAAGFPNPILLFFPGGGEPGGDRAGGRITGAITTTASEPPDGDRSPTVTIEVSRSGVTCLSLAKTVIAHRRQGKTVHLDLPQPRRPAR